MPFDGLFTAAIAAELNATLADARIHNVQQPDTRTLVFHCRRPGQTHRLLIGADPAHPRAHLIDVPPPNPPHPPAFCMLLRKHLEPARILQVVQEGLDRILQMVCEAVDEAGRRVRLVLVAELTGRHSNVILIEEAGGRILDALHRVAAAPGVRRVLMPGETYEPPPVPPKRNPRATAREEVLRLLALPPAPRPVAKTITELFDGFGSFAARQILLRAGLDPDIRHGELTPAGLSRTADALLSLTASVAAGRFQPAVILDETGHPRDFWAYPPAGVQGVVTACAGPSAAAALYYSHRLAVQRFQRDKQRLGRLVDGARTRLERKAANLRQDLAGAERAEEYRLYGELLTVHLHQVPRGAEVTLPNYYADGATVTIPLDPTMSPAENAQRYFKRYAKAKAARTAVREQLEAAEADLAYLEQVSLHLEMADSPDTLAEIEAELHNAGVIPKGAGQADGPRKPGEKPGTPGGPRGRAGRPGREGPEESRPLVARTRRGTPVLIGRNNRQNDRLTLRTARPDDIWLHVKDLPGSHVILQAGPELTDDDLQDAARLAAYFSKARASSKVAVDWTRARHVRKPKGARPGMVIYDHHQTIYVSPDEEEVKALLAMSRR